MSRKHCDMLHQPLRMPAGGCKQAERSPLSALEYLESPDGGGGHLCFAMVLFAASSPTSLCPFSCLLCWCWRDEVPSPWNCERKSFILHWRRAILSFGGKWRGTNIMLTMKDVHILASSIPFFFLMGELPILFPSSFCATVLATKLLSLSRKADRCDFDEVIFH